MIQAERISRHYSMGDVTVKAVNEVSFTIGDSEFVCFVGPSGSGKTTILNMLGLLDAPTSGSLTILGKNTASLSKQQAARFRAENIGFIFQDFNLIPVFSVAENLDFVLSVVKHEPVTDKKIDDILTAVGMLDQKHKMPNQLSGGQKQRVAIARALITNPSLVFADEPTANLDSHSATRVLELMRTMQQELGTTFIFSTHDHKIVNEAKRIITLQDGSIVSDEVAQ